MYFTQGTNITAPQYKVLEKENWVYSISLLLPWCFHLNFPVFVSHRASSHGIVFHVVPLSQVTILIHFVQQLEEKKWQHTRGRSDINGTSGGGVRPTVFMKIEHYLFRLSISCIINKQYFIFYSFLSGFETYQLNKKSV